MAQSKTPDKLIESLNSAVPETEFEALLLQRLNKKLFDVITYKEFLSYVTRAAAEQKWTNDLVDAAFMNSSSNSLLREFALFDPIGSLIDKPADKSNASGGEVERALSALIHIITASDPAALDTAGLNTCLVDLYSEYDALVASSIAP